jgi:hypothetical protein
MALDVETWASRQDVNRFCTQATAAAICIYPAIEENVRYA